MAGSLELIKKVSGTSNVSSFDVTNVFSDKYDVYKIVSMIQTDAAFLEVPMRLLDSGGSEISAAEYDRAFLELRSSTTFGQGKGTGQTSIIRTMRTGTGAAATVGLATTGAVGIVTISAGGSGYTTAPTVTFSAPKHVGAAATAILDSPLVSTGVSITSAPISIGASSFLFPMFLLLKTCLISLPLMETSDVRIASSLSQE